MVPLSGSSEAEKQRVAAWFEENYESYPEGLAGKGIDAFADHDDHGMVIRLSDPIDLDSFKNFVDTLGEEYEAQIKGEGENRTLAILYEEENEGVVHKRKAGITYQEKSEVPLGGVDVPIWEGDEFAGEIVERTLNQLCGYLEHRYG